MELVVKWLKNVNWFNSKKSNIKTLGEEEINGQSLGETLTKACICATIILSVVIALQIITDVDSRYLPKCFGVLLCLLIIVKMSIQWQSYTDNISNKKEQDGLLESFNSCMQNAERVMKAQALSEQQRQEELSNICGALSAIPERIAHLIVEYGVSAGRREDVLSSTSHVEN
ncbi:hypothetical protein [Anaplasma phagocytophilum]|uniref:hypothetical protein n=1 Tax=Anaplasma phagocytophilum TaxID=948 RepID=UPI00200F6402|nr:hypothetical protein [Anaplasma phagocytophilum]UQD53920.1 hypothetical protein ESP60_00150 [Anaplasma phagocytophilum]